MAFKTYIGLVFKNYEQLASAVDEWPEDSSERAEACKLDFGALTTAQARTIAEARKKGTTTVVSGLAHKTYDALWSLEQIALRVPNRETLEWQKHFEKLFSPLKQLCVQAEVPDVGKRLSKPKANPRGNGRRGRPSDTDHKADEKLANGWRNSGERTYQAYADRKGLNRRDVQLAVTRDRKRKRRTKSS